MSNRDYIKSRSASQGMADNIQNWYHSRGYTKVRIWVEEEEVRSYFGTKLPSNYYVRGNIVFKVANINDGMVE